jgi:DNA-binding NarL/FixJ family response regulator
MNQIIKVLLTDDQSLFREGLRTLLEVQPDFQVVGEAANGEEALRLAATTQPEVILMDLRMPVMDGVTATRRIRDLFPHIHVIVLTTFDDDETVFDGLRAGAVGYLLKDVTSEKLCEAIRATARGEYFMQPSITAKVMSEFTRMARIPRIQVPDLAVDLSSRELEVLRQVATGASNKEIADLLVIAEGTVKNHLTSILAKLDARDRMQAVVKARKYGII